MTSGYLICRECSAASGTFERGWRGFLTDEEYGPAEVVILCDICATREFGPARFEVSSDEDDPE